MTLPLLAYLNSEVANAHLSQETPPFRGSFHKYEPQHLARLPVPNFICHLSADALEIGDLARLIMWSDSARIENGPMGAEVMIDSIIKRNLS